MNKKELSGDRLIKRWLSAIKATIETRNSYLQSMKFYTEFTKKTPEQLIIEAETEQETIPKMRLRAIVDYITDFREDQESRLAPTTARNRLNAVMSFYKYYDIVLPALPRSTQKAKPNKKNVQIPLKDEIRELLKHADIAEKAVILVGCSSGLSNVDIVNLRIDDFKRGYDPETEVTTLHLIRIKSKVEFYTFLTPEATRTVLEYLKWRNNNGERTQIVSDDGFLFIKKWVPDEYLKTKNESMRSLTARAIVLRYQGLNKEAGTSTNFGEYNKLRGHAMRKYFNDTLIQEGKCNPYQVDLWMGHDLGESKGAYIVPNPEKQKEIYMQYMHLLTIEKQFDPADSQEFKQMQVENEKLARITAKTAVERDELLELKEKYEKQQAEIEKMKEQQAFMDEYENNMELILKFMREQDGGKKIKNKH